MSDKSNSFWVDPVLYEGRPSDTADLLQKEIRCYDMLDELGIRYYRIHHSVTPTIEACERIDELLGTKICKNLMLCNTQKTAFYLLMMPGDKRYQTKVLSKQIGSSRLSFAPPEFMEEYLDITPGSLSILGLMNDHENHVHLLIDRDVLKEDFLGCHPCINTASLKIGRDDLLDKFLPAVHHDYRIVDL